MSVATKAVAATSRIVHITASNVRSPVALGRLKLLAELALKAEHVSRAELSIALVTSRKMAELNWQHLKHRGPTDVITFALGSDPSGMLQGDIYICPDVARTQAREHGVGMRDELMRLVVHGVLHACGHDHPTDDARTTSAMWRRQEQLLARFRSKEHA